MPHTAGVSRRIAALLLLVTAASATSCGSSPATPGNVTTVRYCTDGGVPLTLDMHEPSAGAAPHPLLVFAHGGSWAFGSAAIEEQNPLIQQVVAGLLAKGYAVASINYRLAPAHPWPAQIIDVRCALRYLRATASRWNVEPHRFAAMGNSAGAQLMSLAALSAGQAPAWDSAQYAGQPVSLDAVVDLWGPVDLLAGGWSQEAIDIGMVVFQVTWGTQDTTLRAASPVTYVHPGSPRFLIVQGTEDTLVPPSQSRELRDLLTAVGTPATLVEVAGAGHELRPSGGPISPSVASLAQQTVNFLVAAASRGA